MKYLVKACALLITFILCTGTINAQTQGIKFEKGLSWAQLIQKAKKENKYIFIDTYTTWCKPCRYMAQEIFTQSLVGNFFNKNFISVAVQIDHTKKDNSEVKRWYNDAALIAKTYNIRSYPTYLFFNPQGELVHTIYSGSSTAKEFLDGVRPVLDTATQYSYLKKKFDVGDRSPRLLLTLIKATQQTRDNQFLPIVTNAYLATQKDLLTDDNIKLAVLATKSSTDPGFDIIKNNIAKVDTVTGKGAAEEIIKTIAFDEVVLPRIRKGGKKLDYGGGMIVYEGSVIDSVDWNDIKMQLDQRYPQLGDKLLIASKPVYYGWLGKWPEFTNAVEAYITAWNDVPDLTINGYAMNVFKNCTDTTCLNAALGWSEKTLKTSDKDYRMWYTQTHAGLLYKLGRKIEAIAEMQHLVNLSGDKNGAFFQNLKKMKTGVPTW